MIEVGDWVMVVRSQPCCGLDQESMWQTFQVQDIVAKPTTFNCVDCGNKASEPIALDRKNDGVVNGFRISRLMKIPPKPTEEKEQMACLSK